MQIKGRMAELVDALDSKSEGFTNS